MGQLFDGVCTSTFTDTHMPVEKKGYIVLEVTHKGVAGMWHEHIATTTQPILTPTHQSENNLMEDRTKHDLLQRYHTTFFSPVKQTLTQAIKKG